MQLKKSYPEYKHWRAMLDRCALKNSYYSKNGIKVCERWGDFWLFLDDMGTKPTPGHTIDRINNDKGYEPGNCRWSTRSEQQINRSVMGNNTSGFRGVCYRPNRKKWRAYIAIEGMKLDIGHYQTKEEAALAYDCASIQLHGNNAKLNLL